MQILSTSRASEKKQKVGLQNAAGAAMLSATAVEALVRTVRISRRQKELQEDDFEQDTYDDGGDVPAGPPL